MKQRRSGEIISTLRRVDLFASCSDGDLALIDSLLERVEVAPGTAIVDQGAPVRHFFVVVDGYAQVSRDGARLGIVGPGSFIGEMALLNGRLCSADVQAVTPMTVCVLGPDQFRVLVNRFPCVGDKVRNAAIKRSEQDPLVRRRQDAPGCGAPRAAS